MVQGRDCTQWFCQDLHAKVLQSVVDPWQKQTHTCSTRADTRGGGAPRARPCANPRASAATHDHACATAIKPAPVPGYLPRCIPCPAPNSPELAHSSGDLSATRQSRPRTTTMAELFPALLHSIQGPR
jgi:hypothetical protein